ncbi:MAG: phosphotransferase [Nanoarchaeota archaeon]
MISKMDKNLLKKLIGVIEDKLGFDSIKEIKTLKGGLSESKNYKIILEGDKSLFVKIFPRAYEKRIKNEENALKILKNTKIPSPNIIYINYEFNKEKGIFIEEFIEGKSLKNIIEIGSFNKESLKEAGRALARLHKSYFLKEWQDPKSNIKSKDEWIEKRVKQRNNHNIKDLRKLGILSEEKRKQLEEYLNKFERYLQSFKFELSPLHGDYNMENIILKNRKVIGILDFEQHCVGHNLSDLGIAYYWFKFGGLENFFPFFLKGYEKEFGEISNTMKILYGYYVMQVLGAIIFLTKNNSSEKALAKLKELLREFFCFNL